MDRKFDDSEIKQALQKYQSGNWEEAINICHKIIKKQPNNFLALELLGICAYKNNQIEQAIAYYQKSLKVNPNYAEIHNNLAVALQEDGQIDAAFSHCQAAIKFRPNYAEAWHNLGRILREKGQFEAAIEHYQKSLELKPNYAEAYNSLGSIFLELGKLAESQKYYQEALKLDKNHLNAHFGLASVFLKQGNFIQGFSEYESRCQRQDYVTGNFAQPVWNGSDFPGKTLLVYTEQGLGDSIQFIRYIPLVKKLGGRVIVYCNKAGLKLLFTTVSEIDELFVIGEKLPDFDLQIPLMSLPRIFGTTLETIPAEIPYLFVPESTKIKLPETTNSFKIGITWETNSQIKTSKKRSCSVEDLQPILNLDNTRFYILQKEVSPQDLEWLKSQTQIHNLSSYFKDLADTAAVIKELDLVITIDTVIAHLAGALGKPVWVILNFDSDWRWLTDRKDSPWYPTMRLFRQSKIGDWDSVFVKVKQALIEFMKSQDNLSYLPANFDLAYQYYQQKNLVEAEKICRLILAEKPQDFQGLHLLAVLEHLTGRNEVAIQLLNQVINLNPNFSQAYSNLATIMKIKGCLESAIAHYKKAISLQPDDSSNYSNLAFIFLQQSQIELAIINYEKYLALQPNNPKKNLNLGFAWEKKGGFSKAIIYYQEAINLQPNYAHAHHHLGFIFQEQGNFTASIFHYKKAIEIDPDYPNAHQQPQNFLSLEILGVSAYQAGQIDRAIAYYQESLKVNPNYAETHNNLAAALQDKLDMNGGIKHYQKSLELKPNYVEPYNGLGCIFLRLGKLKESQKYYEEALKLDKDYANAHFGLALVLLKQGNFIEGFYKYEWRWQRKNYITHDLPQPLWDGSNFLGKTLLVYTEQGLGDSIQFIRYLPLVKKLGGRVIVECHKPELKLLFTTVLEIDELFVVGEKLPDFQLRIPLISLPLILRTTIETIPAKIPYLSIPKSSKLILPLPPGKNFKIGICWQTNSTSKNSQERSYSVQHLQEILSIDKANFYILQKEVSPTDLEWLKSQTQIHNLSLSFKDLADTAAVIKQLDLVITIDTVIAHLAGALGKPVWVILNFDSDWRWLTHREDSPWYPTARLFRQPKIGDWDSILKQVKESLENLLDNNFPTNKISERKPIKLPEEAIQKALAQYKSAKNKKNKVSSTFITSEKNLQTKTSISAINPQIKKFDNFKTSTSEIMKTIAINWPLNPVTGWGIYGINLTLQLLKNPEYQPLLLKPPSIQPGRLNPLHQALLNPVFNEHKNLQNQFKNHQGKKIKLNLPTLQALSGNFSVNNNLVGTKNIGIIFSENTKFTSEQINRSQTYNLIITGSTWNTKILESNGIKPVQKVLQGIDQTIFHPAPKSNIFGDRFVIFSGGKLEYRKGQDIVIAAFKIFQKRHPEALLITAWHNFWPQFMAGIEQTGNVLGLPKISQNQRLQISEWFLENNIPSNAVIDVGPIPNYMVGQILREADVAVFTNRCEGGTNLVAMESLACGVPTIISANTGHLDIINDSHCYPLRCQKSVKPTPHFPGVEGWGESDVEEVVEMLEKVYSDPKDAQLRSNGAVNFMQDLTWEKQIQRLLIVLQNII